MAVDSSSEQYWQSYCYHDAPGTNQGLRREPWHFGVSIVLDSGTRHDISAIRLLILCEDQIRDEFIVKRAYGSRQTQGWFRSSHRTCRSLLAAASYSTQTKKPTLINRTFTIAFKVMLDNYFKLDIVPTSIQRSEPGNTREQSLGPVIYDFTHHIHPHNPTIVIPFVANQLTERTYNIPTRLRIHNIRILPMPLKRPRRFINLPSDVIRYIVKYAIEDRPKGWLRALSNYCLVCKAWEQLIELLFDALNSVSSPRCNLDARKVLRLLHRQPHYGGLIRRLDHREFGWTYKCDDLLEFMQYAKFTTYVCPPVIPLQLVDKAICTLRSMPQVRECVLGGQFGRRDSMDMVDIQLVVSNWKYLESLVINNWGYARNRASECTLPDHLECNLQSLSLCAGDPSSDSSSDLSAPPTPRVLPPTLSGCQLLRFIPPISCNISHVSFAHIRGPSNADYRRFFTAASHSLVSISMLGCSLPRSYDEEYALDAVMPELKVLQYLYADNAVSTLSLVRKTPKSPSLSGDAKRSQFFATGCDDEDMSVEAVEEAMRVTEWEEVDIAFDMLYRAQFLEESYVEAAGEIAEERGIRFSIYIDDEPTWRYEW